MNREIKFRGYNAKNARWLHGHYFINRGGHYIVTDGIANPFLTHEDFTVHPDTVGQFTGMYDADGKEIYEGDIVRTSVAKDAIGVVEWNNDQASFVVHMKGRTQCYPLSESDKIIGNIHDNPELLR